MAALERRAAVLAGAAAAHAVVAAALVAIGLATAVYARKRPGLWAILLFPAWYAAYYAWGSVSLRSYYAPTLQARYFIPCIPFVLVGVSVVLGAAYEWTAESARRLHPPRSRAVVGPRRDRDCVVVVVQLVVIDRRAGNVYGAPMVSQSLRALRSESPSSAAPIVLSETLGRSALPAAGGPAEGLLFSHEVQADQLERWRGRGGFRFMDLHPASPLRRANLNPLIGWRHGLPPSAGPCRAARRVASLRTAIDSGGPCAKGTFDRVGPRSAEIRALLGDPAALSRLHDRPDRGVIVYRVTGRRRRRLPSGRGSPRTRPPSS